MLKKKSRTRNVFADYFIYIVVSKSLIVKPEVKIEILITVNPGNRTIEFKTVRINSLF